MGIWVNRQLASVVVVATTLRFRSCPVARWAMHGQTSSAQRLAAKQGRLARLGLITRLIRAP